MRHVILTSTLALALLNGCSSGDASSPDLGSSDAGRDATAGDATADTGPAADAPSDLGVETSPDASDAEPDVVVKPPVYPAKCKVVDVPVGAGAQCGDDHWCWGAPRPYGSDMYALAAVSASDVWVGGRAGRLEHWDGAKWTASSMPDTTSGAADVVALAPHPTDGVWALDRYCGVSKRSGDAWVSVGKCASLSSFVYPNAMWVGAANDAWIVGDYGAAVHWDGAAFTAATTATTRSLSAIHGLSKSDVWAVGDASTVLHWDGASWTERKGIVDTTSSPDLKAVWAAASDDVWFGGGAKRVFRWNGSGYTSLALPDVTWGIGAIWGSASDDVWFAEVDRYGQMTDAPIYHWDGSSLTKKATIGGGSVRAMAGSSKGDVWAVGEGGTLGHWDGGAWTSLRAGPSGGTVASIWGAASDDVWATVNFQPGSEGAILHFDGTRWSESLRVPHRLDTVHGISSKDVWVSALETTLHWDGATWKDVPLPAGEVAGALWGAASDDVWMVSGTHFRHWTGADWVSDGFDAGGSIRALSGTSTNDVWATTFASPTGTVGLVHWDGARWSVAGTTTVTSAAVASDQWVSSPTDIWILGYLSSLHWDGASFASVKMEERGLVPQKLWGFGANDVWAGAGEATSHWDGSAWKLGTVSLGTETTAIWGCSPDDVWMGGARGTFVRRKL